MQKLEEKVFKTVTMVTKILTRYISVRVPDGPIVTIRLLMDMNSYIAFHFAPRHLTSGDLEGHKRSYGLNL